MIHLEGSAMGDTGKKWADEEDAAQYEYPAATSPRLCHGMSDANAASHLAELEFGVSDMKTLR